MIELQLSLGPPFVALKFTAPLSNHEAKFIKNLMFQLKAHEAFYEEMQVENAGEVIDSIKWFETFLNQQVQDLPPNSWLLRPFEAIRARCRAFLQKVKGIQDQGKSLCGKTFNINDKNLRIEDIQPPGLATCFAAAVGELRGRVGEILDTVLCATNTEIPEYLKPLCPVNPNSVKTDDFLATARNSPP